MINFKEKIRHIGTEYLSATNATKLFVYNCVNALATITSAVAILIPFILYKTVQATVYGAIWLFGSLYRGLSTLGNEISQQLHKLYKLWLHVKSLIQKPIKTKAITPARTPTRIRVPAKKPQESFYEETTRAVEVALEKIDSTVIDEITNKLMSLHGSVKPVVRDEMKQANEKNGIFSIPRFQRTYANIAKQLSEPMTMNEISTMATYATSVMTHKAYDIAVKYKQLAEDGQVTESTSKFYDRETLKSANNVLEKWKMLLANDPNNTPSKDDRDKLIFILASWSCSLVKIKDKENSDAASTYSSDDHTRSANTRVKGQ